MVWLTNTQGNRIDTRDPIRKTIDLLKEGQVVAVKGLGGFHLACDATNEKAVLKLRERKGREEKPLAVMASDITVIDTFAEIGPHERDLLISPRRPIVLLRKKEPNPISESVAPGNTNFGTMLPYTPLHYLLLAEGIKVLVMTSGNISEEPIAKENDEAVQRLGGIADIFLMHNRQIYLRSDDSVTRVVADLYRSVRRSRGYVPVPIFLRKPVPSILAVGGELKNTICLTRGDQAFLSQHIGDLENLETLNFFEECVHHLCRILEIKPEIVACDLHPDYLATQWAMEQKDIKIIGVQHHHAHIAACLAENGREEKVIGLALDGTGYGSDGTIWGGEVLIADLSSFERVGHFQYRSMPGGEKAIREPWRMGISYLHEYFLNQFGNQRNTDDFIDWIGDIPLTGTVGKEQIRAVVGMIRQGLNRLLKRMGCCYFRQIRL
jgi:hydrogenase maturation protein HypF